MGFQLPALVFEGLTVVVSPLKALMQNQVEDLRAKNIKAEYINSSMPEAERKRVHKDLESLKPATKLLYVTPELLNTVWIDRVKSLYSRGLLSSVVVDEAHTVSIWGHDFRPAYVQLGRLKELFPDVPMMACTATATDKVQKDIITVLRMNQPRRFTASFNRPNISYEVRYKDLVENVFADIVSLVKAFIEKGQPSGIIYCHKREDCDLIAMALRDAGIKGAAYHAGLNDSIRSTTLTDWVGKKIDTVVATIAFGMGIDNPNVRYVIHFTIPQTLEDFYQESGRAGRDGEPSVSILYACKEDISLRAHFLSKSAKNDESYSAKKTGGAKATQDSQSSTFTPEQLLRRKQDALEKMADFANKPGCRRRALLAYFGEVVTPNDVPKVCKATCDYCKDPGLVSKTIQQANDRAAFPSGFQHNKWDPDAAQPDLSDPYYDPMADGGENRFASKPPPGLDYAVWKADKDAEEKKKKERTSFRKKLFKSDNNDSDEERGGGKKKKPWLPPVSKASSTSSPSNHSSAAPQAPIKPKSMSTTSHTSTSGYLSNFASAKGLPSSSAVSRPFVPPRAASTDTKTASSPKPVIKQSASVPAAVAAPPAEPAPVRLTGGITIGAKPAGGLSLFAGTILDPNYGIKKRPATDPVAPPSPAKQAKLDSSSAPSNLTA